MPFKKGNDNRYQSENPLDRQPLTIKLEVGQKEKIKAIPDWQNKLRELLKNWVSS